MTTDQASAPPVLIQPYRFVCLVAVATVLYVLAQEGSGSELVLVGVVGVLSLVQAWASGPVLLLLTTAGTLQLRFQLGIGLGDRGGLRPGDLVLCTALLIYVASFYRLRTMVAEAFPPDPRLGRAQPRPARGSVSRWPPVRPLTALFGHSLPRRRGSGPPRRVRAADLMTPREIVAMIILAPAWAVLAQVLWRLLPHERPELGIWPGIWRIMCLVWILVAAFWLPAWVLDYVERRRMSPTEAHLFLQDVAWQETRREQRRIAAWLAWARVRLLRRRDRTSRRASSERSAAGGPRAEAGTSRGAGRN